MTGCRQTGFGETIFLIKGLLASEEVYLIAALASLPQPPAEIQIRGQVEAECTISQ